MNLYQLCAALQTRLRAQMWTASKVFATGSVVVSAAPSSSALRELVMPVCIITPADGQVDPQFNECPQVYRARIVVQLITSVPNDRLGQAPLMGANVVSDSSQGKGLLQIETKLYAAIAELTEAESVNIVFSHAGSAAAAPDTAIGYVVSKDYYFDAFVTTAAT